MSILTRLANRLWPRRLARDLQEEVEFHIDMRVSEHLKAGMSADEATKEAHQQFGHIELVVADMRNERLASMRMLFAMSALAAVVMVLWIVQHRMGTTDLRMPAVAAAPIFRDPNRPTSSAPPPRPQPGPTWEQFVRQTKAFEALQKGPGTYRPGRLLDDKGRLINDEAKTR